ncbi:hypothetical protein WCQ02_42145, partial [Paraburkholderia tropica]
RQNCARLQTVFILFACELVGIASRVRRIALAARICDSTFGSRPFGMGTFQKIIGAHDRWLIKRSFVRDLAPRDTVNIQYLRALAFAQAVFVVQLDQKALDALAKG